MSWAKPAAVRFYFDADRFGLANLLSRERVDFTFPGDPGGRIKKRERHPVRSRPQPVRLRVESHRGELGWLIITRDRHIQDGTQNLVGCAHAQYEAESWSPEVW